MRRLLLALIAAVALLALPVTAFAQDNSAVDEYTENIPGGGGEEPSDEVGGDDSGGGGGSGDGGGALPPGSEQDFQQLGPDGQAAADFTQATAPSDAEGSRGASGGSGSAGGGADDRPAADSGGGVGDVLGKIGGGSGDGDGLGLALPLILGAGVLAAIGFVVARRRGGSQAGPA